MPCKARATVVSAGSAFLIADLYETDDGGRTRRRMQIYLLPFQAPYTFISSDLYAYIWMIYHREGSAVPSRVYALDDEAFTSCAQLAQCNGKGSEQE